jgi:NAD(P)-dependent dehydrogenase (short-subunit alcohol dehydrogenase family)
MDLAGQSAVIVGGTGDIGSATARLFAEAGATVVITGRSAESVSQRVAEIGPVPPERSPTRTTKPHSRPCSRSSGRSAIWPYTGHSGDHRRLRVPGGGGAPTGARG